MSETLISTEITALPMPIRRFIDRLTSETDWIVTNQQLMTYPSRSYHWLTIVDDTYDESISVCFRQRPGEGWRYWHSEDGYENKFRTISDLLYHLGSEVELRKVAR